jgi:subtilisin family serine protease
LEGLKKELSSNNQAKILKTFDSDVFTGVTIESDGYNVDTLNSIDAVKQSWPVSKVELPPLEDLAELVQVNEASNYSIHSWTGVDKAHEAGILGKGVKVAIVDTGIEYTHDAVSFRVDIRICNHWLTHVSSAAALAPRIKFQEAMT